MKTPRPLTKPELEALRAVLTEDDQGDAETDRPDTISSLYHRLPTIYEPSHTDGAPNDDTSANNPGSVALINLAVYHLRDGRQKTGWRQHNPGKNATIHRFGVLPSLSWWTSYIDARMRDAGLNPPPLAGTATVTGEADWLAAVLPFVLVQPWSMVFGRDMLRIHDRLTETVTGKRKFVPKCADCHDQRLEPQDDETWWKCPNCGRDYMPKNGLHDLGRRQPPLTGREIADTLRLPWSTLRTWDERGLIRPEGRDHRGRKLYYLADVKRVRDIDSTTRHDKATP